MTPAKTLLPLPFEELIRRHEREIMRYLLRVTRDPDDAADLFQDTWLRAYRAYPRIDSSTDLRPWLYAIATNLCRNRVRDHSRRSRVLVADNEKSPAAETMGRTQLSRNENEGYALVRVREMLSRLPNKQREALNLRYFAGLEYAAIAAALGCSPESARANVSQAMRKLKGLR